MQFQDVNEIYYPPEFEVKVFSTVRLFIKLDKNLTRYDERNLPDFIINWTYHNKSKKVKPFSLIEFIPMQQGFEAGIKLVRIDNEKDVLKLFCKDILDIFNCEKTLILEWNIKLLG
ncbi:hypothetical protein [Paenibacillus sp. N3.4]|uniref:hypothetical protein n=1 Tax=Paenibacillus sp. N3.4 TaxID=2603222 RepID=UPI0011CADF38|nr:hypothetical protein [Paenibacillus sp. N3.4]TXK76116.1 hypothetical protein FU659_25915 [Paenibacillus sp. N3.4]